MIFYVLIGVLVLLLAFGEYWFAREHRRRLERWALESQYTIISSRQKKLLFGMKFAALGDGMIYRITVRDRNGATHSGYVRCNRGIVDSFLGNDVEAIWDDEWD